MANQNDKLEKAYLSNKLESYGMTRKTIYSIGSVLMCMLLVVVLSVTQAAFDVALLGSVAFWVDFAILAGLSIFGMIAGQQVGDDVARNKPDGAFRKSLKRYTTIYDFINSSSLFAFFEGWLSFYKARKQKRKI